MKSDYDKIKPYIDMYGLVQPKTSGGHGQLSGNGIMYTVETMQEMKRRGTLLEKHQKAFHASIQSCQIDSGLYQRVPSGAFGQEGPDDYIALAAYAYEFRPLLAYAVLRYGQDKRAKHVTTHPKKPALNVVVYLVLRLFNWSGIPNVYNNLKPQHFTLSSYMGRMLPLMAAFKIACRTKLIQPTRLEHFAFGLTVLAATFSKKHDSYRTTHLLKGMASYSRWLRVCFTIWSLYNPYKDDAARVRSEYFNDGGTHPLIELSK